MQTTIIIISFVLGLNSGVVMHRSDFCLAGMFRDLFLFRNSPLLRSLVLLVACTMLIFETARLLGWLQHSLPSSLYGVPSLTNLLGGMLFGIGMVLAGGCVIGTLYKLGAGNLPAAYAFIGLLIGSTAYAEFHPQWQLLSSNTRLSTAASIPQLLGLSQTLVSSIVIAILGWLVFRWHKAGLLRRPSIIKGYLQPRTAALLLALIGFASFALTGMPLGITTSYAKVGAFIEQLFAPDHVASLAYFQTRGFQYLSPLSGQILSAGAGPFWDGLSLVQFPLIGGIIAGSMLSAIGMKKFHLRLDIPKAQLISALIGGILMGCAARMTPACNVWHLLGGLPLLSLQSLLFTIGLLPGAWIGTRLLTRYVLAA